MKLTLEQRTWIERKMWPAAMEAARVFLEETAGESMAVNNADFLPVAVALGVDSFDNEFVTVTFEEGSDDFAEEWLAEFLRERFPGIEIECRTEW